MAVLCLIGIGLAAERFLIAKSCSNVVQKDFMPHGNMWYERQMQADERAQRIREIIRIIAWFALEGTF